MDIWFPERNKMYLTIIDKFSKHATIHNLENRNWIAILAAIKQRIQFLGKPNKLISDGDTCIIHSAVEQFLKENNIMFHRTTASQKTGNADIERFHDTLNEHLRLKNAAKDSSELDDKIFDIINIYNNTIHTTTKLRPYDFISKNLTKEDINRLADFFQKNKETRINSLNIEKDSELQQCTNIVQNRTIGKNKPKYKKLDSYLTRNNYTTDLSTKRHIKYHKKQLKRKYKYQD